MEENEKRRSPRETAIIRTSMIGIAANIALSLFKAAVGLASHSIAIVLDAVNNLTDALSSVITIIGTRLAGKPADRTHPFGHGRIEYLTAMMIAVIVLYAGFTAFAESVRKIVSPETPDYRTSSLIIVAAAVTVKVLLGRYVSEVGRKVHSEALAASGKDALFDAVISASTLAAALVFIIFRISLEAWLGAAIALVIIRSGVMMLYGTAAEVLGKRAEPETAENVRRSVRKTPEVRSVCDLTIHNYGPEKLIGSVHVEVDDSVPISRIDEMSREIQRRVLKECGVTIEAVGIYAVSSRDRAMLAMEKDILGIIRAHDHILETHGFHVNREKREISVDFVADFSCPNRKELYEEIAREIGEAYPDYRLLLTMDVDAGDGRSR